MCITNTRQKCELENYYNKKINITNYEMHYKTAVTWQSYSQHNLPIVTFSIYLDSPQTWKIVTNMPSHPFNETNERSAQNESVT